MEIIWCWSIWRHCCQVMAKEEKWRRNFKVSEFWNTAWNYCTKFYPVWPFVHLLVMCCCWSAAFTTYERRTRKTCVDVESFNIKLQVRRKLPERSLTTSTSRLSKESLVKELAQRRPDLTKLADHSRNSQLYANYYWSLLTVRRGRSQNVSWYNITLAIKCVPVCVE